MDTLICTKCTEVKSISEFTRDKRTATGFYLWCKPCSNEYRRNWRKNATEESREKKRKSDRADYQRHHGKRRESQVWARLEQRYGITREEYEALLDKQGGVCAICGNGCKTGQRLAVDHCHETGRVRGLLCKSCNLHIGILERHEWVAKAQEYLDGSVLRVQQGWQDASGC